MRIIPFLASLLLCGSLPAQVDVRLFSPSTEVVDNASLTGIDLKQPYGPVQDSIVPGTVVLTESARIQALMADYSAHQRPLAGYRVQIFIGDRSKAENTRRNFLMQHPDIPAYLSYLAPNFRVRVGDLPDRVEAEHLRRELQGDFPGLYVVPDQIEPPRLRDPGQ